MRKSAAIFQNTFRESETKIISSFYTQKLSMKKKMHFQFKNLSKYFYAFYNFE